MFNLYPLKGLNRLETYIISNNPMVQIMEREGLGVELNNTLHTLKITSIANPWKLYELLSSAHFPKLTTMDLVNNNFPSINSTWFPGPAVETVKTLKLTNCKIHFVNVDTFNNFKELNTLLLNYNELTIIPTAVFDNLIFMETSVSLGYNTWHCDCSLMDLKILLAANSVTIRGTLKCYSPPELINTEVLDADLCSEESVETTLAFSTSLLMSSSNKTTEVSPNPPKGTTTGGNLTFIYSLQPLCNLKVR